MRVGFHICDDFYRGQLEPIHENLKDDLHCLITEDLASIISFRPDVLLVADGRYYLYRSRLPGTIIVQVRHGFSNKKGMKELIVGSDFCCMPSEWDRDECIRKGWQPRLGYWATGFVSMDGVLNPSRGQSKPMLPTYFSEGRATLLYAPTWNRYLSSAEILGGRWIDDLVADHPDINIIIKPHPHMRRVFPNLLTIWCQAAGRHPRVLFVENHDSDVYQYFPFADILMTDASSVMFYFLALDRPIILVNNPLRHRDWEFYDPEDPEWAWRDLGIEISHVDELPNAIAVSLDKPMEMSAQRAVYRDRVFGSMLDGCAADRITHKIRALANPGPEDDDWVSASWNSIAALGLIDRRKSVAHLIRAHLRPRVQYLNRYPRLKYLLSMLLPK